MHLRTPISIVDSELLIFLFAIVKVKHHHDLLSFFRQMGTLANHIRGAYTLTTGGLTRLYFLSHIRVNEPLLLHTYFQRNLVVKSVFCRVIGGGAVYKCRVPSYDPPPSPSTTPNLHTLHHTIQHEISQHGSRGYPTPKKHGLCF